MQDKKNFYINGQWASPIEPRSFKVINPATEEPCAEISLGGKKDVDAAVKTGIKWQKPSLLKWERQLIFQQNFKQKLAPVT